MDVEVGGSENLMVLLRNGTEDAAAEDTILIELLSFSSMDWGVTGRVGSFKEALADASTWAIRPLERAEEEDDEEDEDENEEDQPSMECCMAFQSLLFLSPSLSPSPLSFCTGYVCYMYERLKEFQLKGLLLYYSY